MTSVEKALNIIAGDWERFFIENKRVSAISNVPDSDHEIFDFVADAEEPEQAFISHNVLEYEGGKSAYHRQAIRRMQYVQELRYGKQAV